MTPDLINGLFELIGASVMGKDVINIHRDKEVKGVWWPGRAFFLGWGLWNVYFYSHYNHVWSWLGGIAMATMNLIWVAQAAYYAGDRNVKTSEEPQR